MLLLALAIACSGGGGETAGGGSGGGGGGTPDTGETGDAGAWPEWGDACAEMALPERPWDPSGDGSADLFALASDVTLPVTDPDGTRYEWSLEEAWSGCDVYLFVSETSRQVAQWYDGVDDSLWSRDVRTFLSALPANVHVFFASGLANEDDRAASLEVLRTELLEAFERMDEEEAAWWAHRVHLVEGRARELDGWLGAHFTSPNWGVAVDRFQRLRYIGSYADWRRYDDSAGWFAPNLSMAANEAVYYNFEAEREAGIEARGDTVVPLFEGELVGNDTENGSTAVVEVDVPDTSAFDALWLDLRLGCDGDGEYGTCPPWDYIVTLSQLSDPEESCPETACSAGETAEVACRYPDGAAATGTCTCGDDGAWGEPSCPGRELGRWITTYHRIGRWVHDATGLLPLLGPGGPQRFAFTTSQTYVVELSLRLASTGEDARPAETTWLFEGGAFDADYNERDPVTVFVPADAKRVELVTVLSGHGQVGSDVCAEFCPTEHHFYVNGTDNEIVLDNAGTANGCMEMVDQGVVPNQYGTWWYGRSGWCPGWQVPVQRTDVTDQVVLGADNEFRYEAYRNGEPYTTAGATIDLQAWLTVWR